MLRTMNRMRMLMKKDWYFPVFHAAIRSSSAETGISANSDSFVTPPPTLPKHVLEHMLSCKYLKKTDISATYGLDYFGNLLFKNLKSEWQKFAERNSHIHYIDDALWKSSSFDTSHCEEDILMRVSRLTESNENSVTMICCVDQSSPLKQRIVIAEKIQCQRSIESETERSILDFMKNLYNHPSCVKVANSPSEGKKTFYIAGDASFEINDTTIITSCKETRIEDKLISKTMVTFVNLYEVFFSVLCDGLMERNGLNYLLLHRNLIPVKVMIVCEALDAQGDVSQLTHELCNMVTSWGITCWNGLEREWSAEDADSIGCLFTIFVKETFQKDGILFLRSISTTISMQVHLTQLYEVLQRYLCNKHPGADD